MILMIFTPKEYTFNSKINLETNKIKTHSVRLSVRSTGHFQYKCAAVW